jgi:hypothetical protein
LLYYARFTNAGKVELDTHSALSAFASPRNYFREGVETDCREIFSCAYVTARTALPASQTPGTDESEYHLGISYGFLGYLLLTKARSCATGFSADFEADRTKGLGQRSLDVP